MTENTFEKSFCTDITPGSSSNYVFSAESFYQTGIEIAGQNALRIDENPFRTL